MKIEIKKAEDWYRGYNEALKDMHDYLMESYQTEFDWDDINLALDELKMPTEVL